MEDVLIYSTLTQEHKLKLREIERLAKKVINAKNALAFNQTCLNNNLLPKYTKIRLHDAALQDSNLTNEFRQNLIKEEIKSKEDVITTLSSKLEEEWLELRLSANDEIVAYIKHLVKTSGDQHNFQQRLSLTKKLNNLYQSKYCLVDGKDKFVNL